jgi:hypothetical protein
MRTLLKFWRWLSARLRLDLDAVCDLSLKKGPVDYHDYPDSFECEPYHFQELTCRRCGKKFTI